MNRLRTLLVFLGVATISGITVVISTLRPGANWAALVDAGLFDNCDQVHLGCQVRNFCRDLPDGGLRPRYGTVELPGYMCTRNAGDTPALIVRWPRNPADGGGPCLDPVGPPADACVLLEPQGTCTDPAVCTEDGGIASPTKAAQDRCACRNPDAGLCRTPNPDGGTAVPVPLGATVYPPFAGAGCVRKVCSEVAGEQGQSWPDECPGG